jgi:hypothetical protein
MRPQIIKFAAAIVCVALGTSFAFASEGEHTNLRVVQTQTTLIRHKGKRHGVGSKELRRSTHTPREKGVDKM